MCLLPIPPVNQVKGSVVNELEGLASQGQGPPQAPKAGLFRLVEEG